MTEIPTALAQELRELATRLEKVADAFAKLVLLFPEGEPSVQADARVFRQAAATARSSADEVDELAHRMKANEEPSPTASASADV